MFSPTPSSGRSGWWSSTALVGLLCAFPTTALGQAPARLIGFWDFNNASAPDQTLDLTHSYVGLVQNGAAFTADAGGRTGAAGDRAMDFGPDTNRQLVRVAKASWLNTLAVHDQMTLSFWQKLANFAGGSSFWFDSLSSNEGLRGAQAHVPWGDQNIYFDTAGCCGAGTQRISGNVPNFNPDFDWTAWHHFTFQKDGSMKRIYIDGVLFLEGENTNPLPSDFTQMAIGAQTTGDNSIHGVIDDFAIFASALELTQIESLAQGASPASLVTDTDADGLPDWWEDDNGLNKNQNDAAEDPDSDGSTNLVEYQKNTNPKQADTDNDGLKDGVETGTGTWVSATDTGTDPLTADTDADGLGDAVETNTGTYVSPTNTGTSPLNADTDGDLFRDAAEVALGTSPVDNTKVPVTPVGANLLAFWDFNNASVADKAVDAVHAFTGTLETGAIYTEDAGGRSGTAGDRAVDFGFDGVGESVRVANASWVGAIAPYDRFSVSFWQKLSEPANSASFWLFSPSSSGGNRGASANVPWSNNNIYFDTAGCCDGNTQRINANVPAWDGTFDWTTWHHFVFLKNGAAKQIWIDGALFLEGNNTAPLPADYSALVIGAEGGGINSIHGQIDEFALFASALDASQIMALAQGKSVLELAADADADGMPDVWEDANGLNKGANDAAEDPDADGLTNLKEYEKSTNPKNADTDSDGLKDGVETGTGTWVSSTDTGTDPLKTDTDLDGLTDGVETNTGTYVSPTNTGSNPNKADGDTDGYTDGVEVLLGSSPTDPASVPISPISPNLLAWWDFNDAAIAEKTTDKIHGFVGNLMNGALFTEDGLGRTEQAGDRAMDLGWDSAQQLVRVPNAAWLNAASTVDRFSVSFWQKLVDVAASSAFWFVSPSSTSGQRGAQAHVPWNNNNIYFDTAGCCDAGLQRINGDWTVFDPNLDWTAWHHFVFLKNGPVKQVWIDGRLFLQGNNTSPLPKDLIEIVLGAEPTGANSMHGLLDDVAVYASALDASQIDYLAKGGVPTGVTSSAFAITSVSFNSTTTTFTITWQSAPGQKFNILRSQNLVDWSTVTTVDASAGATTSYSESGLSLAPGAFFYRVQKQ